MTPMFDRWYTHKADALAVLDLVAKAGAVPIGVVQNRHGTWGALYLSDTVLSPNHQLDQTPTGKPTTTPPDDLV